MQLAKFLINEAISVEFPTKAWEFKTCMLLFRTELRSRMLHWLISELETLSSLSSCPFSYEFLPPKLTTDGQDIFQKRFDSCLKRRVVGSEEIGFSQFCPRRLTELFVQLWKEEQRKVDRAWDDKKSSESEWVCSWRTEWKIDWFIDWLIEWQTDWLSIAKTYCHHFISIRCSMDWLTDPSSKISS